MSRDLPLVAVLTPVYNGSKYLAECIESVLNQTYQNWEYVIVNNCSTDSTFDIANRYAEIDSRIHVVCNSKFVGLIENHNVAFDLISSKSKYCKVVSADDWIYPECIMRMVEVAEVNPSVGIVGSYQLSGKNVRWKGLPRETEVISGREVCRLALLEGLDVLGAPTSSLYRSDLIRQSKPFFPHLFPHADTSACYKHLEHCDYGFVHEVLSSERLHDKQESTKVKELGMGIAASLDILLEYGPVYLTAGELDAHREEFLGGYYRWLGGCVLKMETRDFWRFHVHRLKDLGYPMSWRKVARGTVAEIFDEMQNPKGAFLKLFKVARRKSSDL